MSNRDLFTCRVCGFDDDDMHWGPDDNSPDFSICVCCGVEFGYEDCTLIGIQSWRREWVAKGAVWDTPRCKPADWNLDQQLAQIPERYR